MKLKSLFQTKEILNEADISELLVEIDEDLRRQLQGVLLEMLCDIVAVCKQHKIELFLSGGSALGAVRHKGFIPWDDDLDIAMRRKDYEKFITVFEENLSDRYILSAPNYKDTAIARFPKILKKGTKLTTLLECSDSEYQRIFIDIFILENIPDNKTLRFIRGWLCIVFEAISSMVFFVQNADEDAKKFFKKAGKLNYLTRCTVGKLFSFMDASKWFGVVDKLCNYKKETSLVGFPTGRKHYFGEILEKEKLFPLKSTSFEGKEFYIFSGYDYYLHNLFGNYMQIPPKNKRETHFVKEIEF